MRPVGVDAVILDERGRVLLGHRTDEDAWNLPGGGIEPGETPWAAAEREVAEEVALVVEAERLLGVSSQPPAGHLVFDFLCRVTEGEATPCGVETDHVGWFGIADLPLTMLPRQADRVRSYLAELPVAAVLFVQPRPA
jgi:ADP-ribose pyrophosphatase YjhB (NUDIX family)